MPSSPPRLALTVRRGARPSAERWREAVANDLGLLDDVTLVRRRAELELIGLVELEEGRRVLHARLVDLSDGSARWEQAFDLGSVDQPRAAAESAARRAGHVTSDAVLETLTGRRGGFESTLVFARRIARRRKDVFRAASDGQDLWRVSSGHSIAMLPTLAHGDVWYSVVDESGLFLTRATASERPVIGADEGLTMGVQPCGGGIVFSSTRDGDTEIYSASTDLSELHRLTFHPGIDVSPSCGPDGRLVFVSNRSGSPRIHVLAPGELQPHRIAQPDSENQTPVVCPSPEQPMIAFTRVERGRMSVWTMPLEGGEATRVSPARGRYKDPAFSPDCRLLAYVGNEGIWVSSLDGRRRRLVVRGAAETVRWGRLGAPSEIAPAAQTSAPTESAPTEAPSAVTPSVDASP